ncbi:MAG: 4Fe-4S binding protein [Deltaproteobacteria bacterium]|nr:4Fe-4S binding protein [Deltaproteobacteria bacterium]
MLQIIRRTIQVSGIVLIIFIPFLSLYGVLAENYRLAMVDGEGWQRFFDQIDRIVRYISDDPIKTARALKGSLFWSVTIKDFNISDPLTFVGSLFGSLDFYSKLFISIVPLVLLTLLLGRVYCGWLCPMNLMFELNSKIRTLLRKVGINTFNVSFARLNKYMMLIVGAVLSLVLGVQVFSFIYPPILLNRELIHLIYFGSVGTGAVMLVLIFIFEISISQRAWCRYFCPGGALWSLMGAKRLVQITIDRQICDDCGKCNLACEFGLDPMRGKMGMECDNCGKCVSKCKPDALKYSIVFPWQRGGVIRERNEEKEEFRKASN